MILGGLKDKPQSLEQNMLKIEKTKCKKGYDKMDKNIVKPVTLIRQEFIDTLVDEINNCQLPMFVIEPILQDLLDQVRTAAQKQYESDKRQYEEQLKEVQE